MSVKVVANVKLDTPGYDTEGLTDIVAEYTLHDHHAEKQTGVDEQILRCRGLSDGVDRPLQYPGRDQHDKVGEEQADETEDRGAPVSEDIGYQALQ